MNKKPSLNKAEMGLLLLMIISVPLYALALKKGGISSWWYIGDAIVMIAWVSIFILPNLLKQMKQEKKQEASLSVCPGFLAGTKSLQKDDLYTYCFTLTLADGSQRDPTATFDSLLAGMLGLSPKELTDL